MTSTGLFLVRNAGDYPSLTAEYRKRIGPEECFRYHGTKRQCKLGILTKTFCTASSCAVCSILKHSFRVDVANPSGA